MTPSERLHSSQRLWTPRILTANTIFSAGAVVLWFFVSSWVTDIKLSVSNIQTSMWNENVRYEARLTKTETRLDTHDLQLAKLERGE